MSATRQLPTFVLLAIGVAIGLGGLTLALYGVVLTGNGCATCPIDRGAMSPTYIALGSGLVAVAGLHLAAAVGLRRRRRWPEFMALTIAAVGIAACVLLVLGELNLRGFVADASGVLRPQVDIGRLFGVVAAAIGYTLVFLSVIRRLRASTINAAA